MPMAEERSDMMDGGEKADYDKMDDDKMDNDMSDRRMDDSDMMCMPRKASKCVRDLVYGLINTKAYGENKHCRYVSKAGKCIRKLVYGLINTKAYGENKHCRYCKSF